MADIFLSYAHEDLERARGVAEALTAEGWTVFWDRRIPPGWKFEKYIEQRVRECCALVVLWSPHAVASDWVGIEAAVGRKRKILVPILIEPAEIPFGYDHLHAADLTAWQPGGRTLEFEALVSSIESLAPRPPRIPPRGSIEASAQGPSPPSGTRPLETIHPTTTASTTEPDGPRLAQDNRVVLEDPAKRQPSGWPSEFGALARRAVRLTGARAVAAVAVLAASGSLGVYLYRAENRTPVVSQDSRATAPEPAQTGRPQASELPYLSTVPPATGGTQARAQESSTQPKSNVGTGTSRPQSSLPLRAPTAETPPSRGRGATTVPAADSWAARAGAVKFRSDAWNLPDEPLLGFVEIPAGPFLMGGDKSKDAQAADDERWGNAEGQGRLELPLFYLGRYEVTVAQFQAYVTATNTKPGDSQVLQGPGDHPVCCVSWHEAMAYCEWLEAELKQSPKAPSTLRHVLQQRWHVGLPSEAEWEKAARGTHGRVYPWGNKADTSRANYGSSREKPVGSYPSGASPYGLLDMAGNEWEWTRSLYRDYPYVSMDGREDLKSVGLRVIRGGAFRLSEQNVRAAFRGRYDPDNRSVILGFRVVVSRF